MFMVTWFQQRCQGNSVHKIKKKETTYPYLTCRKKVHIDPHLTPHTVNSEGAELTQGLSATALLAFPTGWFCALKAVLGPAVPWAPSPASIRCYWPTPPAGTLQTVFRYPRMCPGEQNFPAENHWPKIVKCLEENTAGSRSERLAGISYMWPWGHNSWKNKMNWISSKVQVLLFERNHLGN